MKVLLASQAIPGHFNPMTGIGVRLKDEGHDVGWYTGRTLAGKLEGLGIPHYPFDRAIEHTGDNLNELYPQRAKLKGPMAIRFDGERIVASNVTNFFEDIRDVQQQFPFDVVVVDNTMFVQRLVAVVLGKPVVSFVPIGNMESDPLVPPMFFGFAPARTPAHKILHAGARLVSDQFVTKPARNSYVRQLRGYGLHTERGKPITDEPYRWSDAIIQTGTASLDFPRRTVNPKVHYVGALLPHRPGGTASPGTAAALTADARQPTSDGTYRRTVVVTQGTVDNRDPAKLMVPTIEALKDTDSRIIVATGGAGTEELRRRYPQPNVVVEDYIDFARVFPFTDVFVTNGGFGGVLLSLSYGVPLVTAGLNEGKNDVNARVEFAGVGVNLKTETPSAAAVRSAVDTLLSDPSWRARAQEMRGQFEAEDSVGAAIEVIKAAAGSGGTPAV
ncbi:nucleotide disphospho-sugar-binding domain-containing protein [Arthrobacter sp. NicSoilB8]|uniref:glycosyltransferase n=1 Tax=Arthrobacter sp. NicSoilB8 TaxID=2830998 RepID=UPI001CC82768|nr:nucleotide disphospho-sugar-binding domain-containing protein [Arthrobacter sp. NicSoilB8]BCW69798.1 glycosyl transferase [Arthrobacter sp. NicSoilB8]